MTRPVTLFAGRWADLPFEEVARLGVLTVVGFTGPSIWKDVAMFPPAAAACSGPTCRGRTQG